MSIARILGQTGKEVSGLIDDVFGGGMNAIHTGIQGQPAKTISESGRDHIHNLIRGRLGEVVPTRRAMESMEQNVSKAGRTAEDVTEEELFAGVTAASEYKGNWLTQGFNTDSNPLYTGLVGAGVGLLGAAAVGGDTREGAAIGAVAGFGASVAGRAIMKNLDSVQENFMGSLLKGKTVATQGAEVTESLDEYAMRKFHGTKESTELTIGDLVDDGFGNNAIAEIWPGAQRRPAGSTVDLKIKDLIDGAPEGYKESARGIKIDRLHKELPQELLVSDWSKHSLEVEAPLGTGVFKQGPEVPVMQAHRNDPDMLKAHLENLKPEEIKKAGFGAQYKHDVLMGKKDLNVAQATRIAGFTGTALSGMAFSSSRRDHRRGFNKKRGNRV
jgi:hypothetical protein